MCLLTHTTKPWHLGSAADEGQERPPGAWRDGHLDAVAVAPRCSCAPGRSPGTPRTAAATPGSAISLRTDIDHARELIPDLVTVIHCLLVEHGADPVANCPMCVTAWPCRVVTTIHSLVTDPQRRFTALIAQARSNG